MRPARRLCMCGARSADCQDVMLSLEGPCILPGMLMEWLPEEPEEIIEVLYVTPPYSSCPYTGLYHCGIVLQRSLLKH